MRILFLARSLHVGGSERQLIALATGLAERGHHIAVAVFYAGGALEPELTDTGIEIIDLGKSARWSVGRFSVRLIAAARKFKPDIVHSYLPIPNIVTFLLRPWLPRRTRIVWAIRHAGMPLDAYDRVARISYRLEPRLATAAALIIVNSQAGRAVAEAAGFPPDRMEVVVNGVDTDRFYPDPAAGRQLRETWGVADETPLIGLPARLDPVKGHDDFIAAAAIMASCRPDIRFVCIGDGPAAIKARLQTLATQNGLGETLVWAGETSCMRAAYNALDISCLASLSEGAPNTVLEAMACGTPCVVTDVGDAAVFVMETGIVVPPHDPPALAEACLALLTCDAGDSGAASRRRITTRYSRQAMVDRTETLLRPLALQ